MPKEKISLNSIYISERLQKSLQPVSNSALTAITAPMGYGKTTAVNWYLSRLAKDSQALLIRISIYSQNLSIFWKSVQNAFSFAGLIQHLRHWLHQKTLQIFSAKQNMFRMYIATTENNCRNM